MLMHLASYIYDIRNQNYMITTQNKKNVLHNIAVAIMRW